NKTIKARRPPISGAFLLAGSDVFSLRPTDVLLIRR
ncbi:MAG: hypothetical protein ACI9XZ_002885, partial [Alphaproteobacteria bacterium]